jgi:hypothetical protein
LIKHPRLYAISTGLSKSKLDQTVNEIAKSNMHAWELPLPHVPWEMSCPLEWKTEDPQHVFNRSDSYKKWIEETRLNKLASLRVYHAKNNVRRNKMSIDRRLGAKIQEATELREGLKPLNDVQQKWFEKACVKVLVHKVKRPRAKVARKKSVKQPRFKTQYKSLAEPLNLPVTTAGIQQLL